MKRLLFLLLFIPICYADTGVVVETDDVIYKGCVDVNGDAYDALKEFSRKYDVAMKFDGVMVGMPFLKAVEGVEGKSLGDNKFSGWNFWVAEDDEYITPQLASGYGAGIGDYGIDKREVVAVNFAVTEFNADWTVKESPEKPEFFTYRELCERLKIDTTIDVDGKRETGDIDVWPGSKLELELEIENNYDDMKDAYVEAEIDDLEESTDEEDIDDGKKETFQLEFDIPLEIEEDDLELIVTVYGEGYEEEHIYDVNFKKEDNGIILSDNRLMVDCENLDLDLEFLSIGTEDTDVKVRMFNDKLGMYKQDEFTIGENEKVIKAYNIEHEAKEGEYVFNLEIDYGEKIEKQIAFELDGCQENKLSSERTVKDDNSKQKATKKVNIAAVPQEDKGMPYLMLGTVFFGVFLASSLIVLISRK